MRPILNFFVSYFRKHRVSKFPDLFRPLLLTRSTVRRWIQHGNYWTFTETPATQTWKPSHREVCSHLAAGRGRLTKGWKGGRSGTDLAPPGARDASEENASPQIGGLRYGRLRKGTRGYVSHSATRGGGGEGWEHVSLICWRSARAAPLGFYDCNAIGMLPELLSKWSWSICRRPIVKSGI